MIFGIPADRMNLRRFAIDLYTEITEDFISNGAAALAYYFFLAIFPAMIFLLSLLPYLPIHHLHEGIMDFIRQALPGQAANTFEKTIAEVTLNRHSGLLSFGAIFTLWTSSSGIYAIMQQLNITYDVNETRPYWRARVVALILTILCGGLVVGAALLIVVGGLTETWLGTLLNLGDTGMIIFATVRWIGIACLAMTGFAFLYYWGPDVEQRFKFITPGSIFGVIMLSAASVGFRGYVENFSDYTATYGSIGAIIVLMVWLYIIGIVILVGSELNALIEHYSIEGKSKGEHSEPKNSRGFKALRRKPLPVNEQVGKGRSANLSQGSQA